MERRGSQKVNCNIVLNFQGQGNYLAFSGQHSLFYGVRNFFWFDSTPPGVSIHLILALNVFLGSFHMIALQLTMFFLPFWITWTRWPGQNMMARMVMVMLLVRMMMDIAPSHYSVVARKKTFFIVGIERSELANHSMQCHIYFATEKDIFSCIKRQCTKLIFTVITKVVVSNFLFIVKLWLC